ncbi:Smg-4/UPF3 family protein [Toxoplasma gondii TgCatPRC2]|uniref:Smg-4/UPF3 family domain protein n=4 Tax=Toxoplasma gondii TaxID=5811 RepID=A0A125YW30_TOXGV|nr:Smg-4/UPF3 family protein [Toxoplasma gondii ME49]ESS35319.1 Smg-4/UPF3 family protein [Toxoplasma gondii VEG]KYF40226.1 Smg-4/UPF3 family protein [Toxoplasma gondii ARI]KYK65660.1 Smg-4/UPF3 family protein [Toxoplasma gondii TgCatPRC2]EPT25711.1 Smg-4/UPF3 family protein [Toxoplasma gondii ME49]CEL77772.1 TPA: smg-4/UPF3 family domain protein [Toxoplasma gondii VEG]|eukprot:XP_018635312.1 Smg-4/UPF3 family protein [Toxoplasma gondii ME49]
MPPREAPTSRPRGERPEFASGGSSSATGVAPRRSFVPGMILTKQLLIPVKSTSPSYAAGSAARDKNTATPARPPSTSRSSLSASSSSSSSASSSTSSSSSALSSSSSSAFSSSSPSQHRGQQPSSVLSSVSAGAASSARPGEDGRASRGVCSRGDSRGGDKLGVSNQAPSRNSPAGLGADAASGGRRGEREPRAPQIFRGGREAREQKPSNLSRGRDIPATSAERGGDGASDRGGCPKQEEARGSETRDRGDTGENDAKGGKPSEDTTSENVQATTQAYKAKTKTKVVVRLLPPSAREEDLLELVAAPLQGKMSWTRFVPGRQQKSDVPSRNSTWYVNFSTEEDADDFIKSFHGKVFVDERHNTFKAVARLAPYQKVPRKTGPDRREGSLAKDPLYVNFLQALKDGTAFESHAAPPGSEELETVVDDDGVTLSSLVLALREKYGVKTFVKGCPYTLAMWRRTFAVSGSEEEDLEASGDRNEVERRDEKSAVRRRGKGSAKTARETQRTPAAASSVQTASGPPGASGARSLRPGPSPSSTQSNSSDTSRSTAHQGTTGSEARGVWRALLGIQKRPTTAGGSAKPANEPQAKASIS